jgi:hypothetical protein
MSISLEGSIRTCKVDQGWASRVESDRFLNPNLMVCPTWNGVDQYGRFVQPDSYYTKNAGCESAEDRVLVENALRPMYAEYVTLDAKGLEGAWDGQANYQNLYGAQDSQVEQNAISNLSRITGNAGVGFRAAIQGSCAYTAGDSQGQMSQMQRQMNKAQSGYMSNVYKVRGGMR